ncbi:hypothetical protein [Dankookia sp. P2]|uniref:hypothetical protein n=1 Tax=Dankookia sp. P2 TaxID=3423955 RepID=UPI003D66D4AC
MSEYDLVVRGGEVATGFGTARCDIGIRGGRIVALAERIEGGASTLDAGGLLVLPGGVDSHCHIEEPSRGGYVSTAGVPPVTVNEESFLTASNSAFAGGTTSVVCFAAAMEGRGASCRAWPTTSSAPRAGCWTTASTRSSPTRPRRCWSARCRRSWRRASAA